MKKLPLLWLLLLMPVLSWAQARASEPSHTAPDFAHLQAAIAGQPDTVQIDQLREYVDVMVQAGRLGEAEQAANAAVQVAQTTHNALLLSGAYLSQGYLATYQSDYVAAVQAYQRGYDLVKNTTHYKRQVQLLQLLGTLHLRTEDLPTAERYTQQALVIAQRHALLSLVADTYNNLSNIAGLRRDFGQARAYNERAMRIYRHTKEWSQYYSTLINQGITYKNLGQPTKSERAYREVLAYTKATPGTEYMEEYVYPNLANTLLVLNRPAEAEQCVRQGLASLQPGAADKYQELYDVLTRIKEQQRDYQQALAAYRTSVAYRDTLLNSAKNKLLLEVETRYQTKENQVRIARLHDDNARQVRQLWALGLGLSVLLCLLGISIWQYFLIGRKNDQLQATNQVVVASNERISEQASRLTVLMKELHHRVKNNLAIVSSLLRLQSSRLTDQGAVKAVREGQQRIEAMSLIHQRLYQTDDVTTVDMQLYVNNLVEGLLAAYGYAPEQVTVRVQVPRAALNVDQAVPLGLILNELLTNSFKYAYDHVAHPALSIYLGPGTTADELLLEVQDNGPGFDPTRWQQPGGSFGKRLVTSLSEQLGAELTLDVRQGTRYHLRIPAVKLLAAG